MIMTPLSSKWCQKCVWSHYHAIKDHSEDTYVLMSDEGGPISLSDVTSISTSHKKIGPQSSLIKKQVSSLRSFMTPNTFLAPLFQLQSFTVHLIERYILCVYKHNSMQYIYIDRSKIKYMQEFGSVANTQKYQICYIIYI